MKPSKTCLVCFSPTQNTRTAIKAVGQGLGLPVRLVDLTLPGTRAGNIDLGPDEILVVGLPVYGGRLPALAEDLFKRLPQGANLAVPVVVYGNREYEDALLELADMCRGKGYALAGAAAFIGEHSYDAKVAAGRPNGDDQKTAESFGAAVAASTAAGKTFDPKVIPGHTPYRTRSPKIPAVPEYFADECQHCLICAKCCPTGAVSEESVQTTDPDKCILCAACVKRCPAEARRITFAPLMQFMAKLAADNAEPKQPAVFV